MIKNCLQILCLINALIFKKIKNFHIFLKIILFLKNIIIELIRNKRH